MKVVAAATTLLPSGNPGAVNVIVVAATDEGAIRLLNQEQGGWADLPAITQSPVKSVALSTVSSTKDIGTINVIVVAALENGEVLLYNGEAGGVWEPLPTVSTDVPQPGEGDMVL